MYIDFRYAIELLSVVASTMSALVFMVGVLFVMSQTREYTARKRKADTAAMLPAYLNRLDVLRKNLRGVARNPESEEDKIALYEYLGELDSVSLLILSDVWDERLAEAMLGDEVHFAFKSGLDTIMMERNQTGRSALFSNLEQLAYRWGRG